MGFEQKKKKAALNVSVYSAPLVSGQYPLGWVLGGNMVQSAEEQNRHCINTAARK